MIVHLGDGIIAAMPNDSVSGSYNEQNVFTSAAPPRQCYEEMTVTSLRRQVDHIDCDYDVNNVFKQPASLPLAYQTSPPVAYQSPVVVLSLRRQAEKFYAFRSLGAHIFSRHK